MRLQLHHRPLLLRGTPSGLRGETADGGDGGGWGGEGRQQAGPQAALQGAQRSPCTSWQQQQGGAALPVQQKRLIDQLLDDVYFRPPVQVEGRRLLWRFRGTRGGAVSILSGVTGRLGGVWRRRSRGERGRLPPTSVGYLRICRLLPGRVATSTVTLFFIATLQGLIDGAEARRRGQEDGLALTGLLQLLLPLQYLLPLLQLLLLLLQLHLEVSPLFQLLLLRHLPHPFFGLLHFLTGGFRSLLPLSLQQLFLVLLQPAELWAQCLLPMAPGWKVSTGEFGRVVRGPTGSYKVAVLSG